MRRRVSLLPVFVVCLGLSACTSLGDSLFLVQNLSDPAKSRALTDAGIAAYNDVLVKQERFDRVDAVKRYFATALRYDPTNATAQRYLALADGFSAARLRDTLKEAKSLLAQKGRQEDDDYQLALDAQRAARIDRNNAEVVKLLKDSATLRSSLAALYVTRARSSLDKLAKTSNETAREPLYVDAFQNSNKAVLVDPGNSSGRSLQSQLRSEIADLVKRRLATLEGLIDKGSFSAAGVQLSFVSDLNDKLGGEFDDQIRAAGYDLNYRSAGYYYSTKSYDRAETRVNAAIALRRAPEALALLQKITEDRSKSERGATFEDGIKIVDAALARGDLGAARRSVDYLAGRTTESAKLALLDDRRAKIKAALADVYSKAVDLYKAENFADAIDLFQTVVAVDAGYQQAADYLDKAKAKQQLLDQY